MIYNSKFNYRHKKIVYASKKLGHFIRWPIKTEQRISIKKPDMNLFPH